MILINQALLVFAVKYLKDVLQSIARSLTLPSYPDHGEKEKEFMQAVDSYDSAKANAMLNSAINNYCGSTDAMKGIEEWCAKFNIHPDHAFMGEMDWLRLIARNRNKIDTILSNQGL